MAGRAERQRARPTSSKLASSTPPRPTSRPRDAVVSPAPPTLASPGRRIFHSLLAVGGWVLFCWWWWLVLGRLDYSHARFTLVFIAVTLVVCVTLTAAWAYHNRNIFKRKGPRTHVPSATFEFREDRLGRALRFVEPMAAIERARIVRIDLDDESKTYRALERFPAPATNGAVPTAAAAAHSA
jgi:hypothetical protein